MKNVTVSLDDGLLREARRVAAERDTTLNALIRDYLERLTRRESHAKQAKARILELCRQAATDVGPRTWTRDDLHER
jgi:metal-responsive CopG/Arc/MetJ family transcriptional regulator